MFSQSVYGLRRFFGAHVLLRVFNSLGKSMGQYRLLVWVKCIALSCLLWGIATQAFAQEPKKSRKNEQGDRYDKGLIIQDFIPNDTTSVLQKPGIDFPNINVVPFYYQPALLAQIQRYEMNKQWQPMFEVLYRYVSNFGIDNFKDMRLVWKLAGLSEYLGKEQLTRDLYRLILKHHRGDLKQALAYYDSLTQFDKDVYADLNYYFYMAERRRAVDTLLPPQDVLLNMGDLVNSDFDDYAVTITGKKDDIIYFSSKRNRTAANDLMFSSPGNPRSPYNEDLFISQKDEYGEWGEAKPLNALNSPYNEGSPCLSPDGTTLIFVRCNNPESYGDCDLYSSQRIEGDRWSRAVNMGAEINSPAWDSHPAFSITGDTLYFASARAGGFGGTDIYYTVRKKDGSWLQPLNLGPIVNTRGKEVSPFPHPKFDLLYFSSDNHVVNFGGFDIFKSFNINGKWSEPKNVGPLVNGEGDEIYFSIDSQSKWLFYAKSVEDNGKNLDLHSFPLPMEAKPNNIVRFSGMVVEPVTGEVFQGIVTVVDMTEGTEIAPKHIRDDGSFEFDLIKGREYLVIIEGDNFFNISELFYVNGDMQVTFDAIPVKNIVFNSIDFESGSSELLPDMENNLHLVIDFLSNHPGYNVRVLGHTDSDGDPKMNLKLSQDRADAIKRYIISYGNFAKDRVEAVGKGSSEPIILEQKSEKDKKINRRVEFNIFPNGQKAESDF